MGGRSGTRKRRRSGPTRAVVKTAAAAGSRRRMERAACGRVCSGLWAVTRTAAPVRAASPLRHAKDGCGAGSGAGGEVFDLVDD